MEADRAGGPPVIVISVQKLMNPELLFVNWGLQCLPALLGVALV